MTAMRREGGCHCGAVRYAVTGPPLRHSVCHCRDCRRSAGAPLVAWAVWPEAAVTILSGDPAEYASSAHARRRFCPACGTGLFYVSDEAPFVGKIDVQTSTLDDPDALPPPTEQIQTAERIGWVAGLADLSAHVRWP